MANYLIVNEAGIIDNIIVINDPEMIEQFNGKEFYNGAKIGEKYFPPELKINKIK